MSFKRVTIHSDGTGPGTIIIDESGNKLEGVISATVRMNAGEYNTVDLEVMAPATQVSGKVDSTSFMCPVCEEYVSHDCRPATLSGT